MSKRKSKRKPTKDILSFTTKDVVSRIGITVDKEAGTVTPLIDTINHYVERSYARPKGNKTVSRIPVTRLQFDREDALWDEYDYLCAIDTNTRIVDGKSLSVTVLVQAVRCCEVESNGTAHRSWKRSIPEFYSFETKFSFAEKIGWQIAIERLEEHRVSQKYPRIGIIVDAYLDQHRHINARRTPILVTFLPLSMTLIYASTDTGKDEFANFLIGQADVTSNQILRQWTTTGGIPERAHDHPHGLYTGLRLMHADGAIPLNEV